MKVNSSFIGPRLDKNTIVTYLPARLQKLHSDVRFKEQADSIATAQGDLINKTMEIFIKIAV
jgi:hypothetical protein